MFTKLVAQLFLGMRTSHMRFSNYISQVRFPKNEASQWNMNKLAFLTLCDLALNPPFLGGKMIELGKFCFIKTKFEPNLSCFSK